MRVVSKEYDLIQPAELEAIRVEGGPFISVINIGCELTGDAILRCPSAFSRSQNNVSRLTKLGGREGSSGISGKGRAFKQKPLQRSSL